MDTLTLLFNSACSLPHDEVVTATTSSFTNSSHTTTSTTNDEDAAAAAYLSLLPNEVLLLVASYIGIRGLGVLAQADRRLHSIAEDDSLWRELFRARFGCSNLELAADVKSWKLTFQDYQSTPRWHPTEKHPELAVLEDGLVVTTSTDVGEGDTGNRSIRAAVDYAPGSGLHYFEVTSLCPNDVMYHPYVGLCSTKELEPITALTMWRADLCYAYAGNGTLYSSRKLDDDHRFLEKFHYGDVVGMAVDQRDKARGWLQFYLNKKPIGRRLSIEGTWFPCVGTFHSRHVLRITVRPQLPKDEEEGGGGVVEPSTEEDGQLECA